ncbi:MAG TPA: hypothetical protein VF452_08035 [Candidatus Binatia bacterium]
MKTKAALLTGVLLISGSLAVPSPGFTGGDNDHGRKAERSDRHDRNDRDRRDLQGTWYMNGDRDKRAAIDGSGRDLQAKNEKGQTSRLEVDRRGNLHAMDWNVTGHVRGDRIEWDNGTTWTRG